MGFILKIENFIIFKKYKKKKINILYTTYPHNLHMDKVDTVENGKKLTEFINQNALKKMLFLGKTYETYL